MWELGLQEGRNRQIRRMAAAVGCDVAQIVKSLVFRGRESGRPLLVIASGANRVDERKLAAAAGESVGKADAAFVREQTGFAIGGVAPLAHPHVGQTQIEHRADEVLRGDGSLRLREQVERLVV